MPLLCFSHLYGRENENGYVRAYQLINSNGLLIGDVGYPFFTFHRLEYNSTQKVLFSVNYERNILYICQLYNKKQRL